MEEFDSEDFSTSEEDEDYVPSGGEYSEDDVNELVKEDEVDGEEQTQKTKGKKRKAQSIPARKKRPGGLSLEEEEEDANPESEGSSSEEEDEAAEQDKGVGSEDARKKKADELWASFLNDVGPKSKVSPSTQVKKGEETEETSSSKLLVKAEELEKPKETEKVKITKVFDFAGEEVRVTKEVDATSKEAKSFFKQNEKEKPQANVLLSSLPSLSSRVRDLFISKTLFSFESMLNWFTNQLQLLKFDTYCSMTIVYGNNMPFSRRYKLPDLSNTGKPEQESKTSCPTSFAKISTDSEIRTDLEEQMFVTENAFPPCV
nr:craniofacial development protein 1 [Aotus nancymaae]